MNALNIIHIPGIFLSTGITLLSRKQLLAAFGMCGLEGIASEALVRHFVIRPSQRDSKPLLQRTMHQLQHKAFLPVGVGIGYGGPVYLIGRQTMTRALTAFKEALEVNTFLDKLLPASVVQNFKRTAEAVQQRRSKRLEIWVADVWKAAGLSLPHEKNMARTGINKVPVATGMLKIAATDGKDLGDLDVLALEPNTNTVFIAECKMYGRRPLTALDFSSDMERFQHDLVKVRARHDWVQAHLPEVLSLIGRPIQGDYQVRTIIVTGSPSFGGTQLPSDQQIEYTHFPALAKRFLLQ